MIRKIVVPQERTLTLELPETFVGKEVEVLAFEVDEIDNHTEPDETVVNMSEEERIAYLRKTLSFHQVDLSNFTFDRDEANRYD